MSVQARIIIGIVLFLLGMATGWKWERNAMLAQDDARQKQIVALQNQLAKANAALDAKVTTALNDEKENAKANETAVETDRAKNPTGYNAPVPVAGMLAYRRAIAATAAAR